MDPQPSLVAKLDLNRPLLFGRDKILPFRPFHLYPYPSLLHRPPPNAMSAPLETPPLPGRFVQPPRPPNAWILYRSDKLRQLPPTEPGNPRRAQAEVSKMISS